MYVEYHGGSCIDVAITQGSATYSRGWDITMTQIVCPSTHAPPTGCTQYFTGTSGTIESFNFALKTHLSNLNYKICVRRERLYCTITWTAPTFSWSGKTGVLSPALLVGDAVSQRLVNNNR
ncbi:uncharacterized protein LOC111706993 [Eurytemora carolleeae]|uniref:uncharacterized protein LOC111706993 n=1 Tax=Eurytemora carolleeae TaxID=1294199 RepID=UPI000C7928FD|nr:uncharacterized protein LOC111706993 [Eurytemora carolleeae]|eukprot:XP_023335727.1 uncharacterized protein LOC111706993 [Eurytemora affinis]